MQGYKSTGKPITLEIAQARLDNFQKNYTLIIKPSSYRIWNEKCCLIDENFGEFWIEPWKILEKGAKHPKRHKSQPWTVERLQILLNKLPNNHLVVLEINQNEHRYAKVCDSEFGEFSYRIDHLIGGALHPKRRISKKKTSLETVKQKIFKIYGDEVTLDEATFVTASKPAKFIDKKYGEFWRAPTAVYGYSHRPKGTGHPHRKFDKISQIKNNAKPIVHWKTNETLYPMSSYEWAVIKYFNENQIDFDFQIPFQSSVPTAVTGKNSTYFVDFYVKSGKWSNTYVEVKGRFNKTSEAKWLAFHEQHSNSELWDCDKLIELDIMKYRRHSLEMMNFPLKF